MSNSDHRRDNVDFVIGEEDLPEKISVDASDLEVLDSNLVFCPSILQITAEDLAQVDQQILKIGKQDLSDVLCVSLKDLPENIKINLADLPADLNNVTTACYHGTSRESAERILKEGFRVGPGNASGSGIYFSVGGVSIAQGYVKGTPCIIHAKVAWGKVAYLDDPKVRNVLGHCEDAMTAKALSLGYNSFLTSSKYSQRTPAVGIVLGKQGTHIRPPRIEVVELIDPRKRS